MNIYVAIKQTPVTETKIKLKADQSGIDISDIKWIISPFDELAIEEALRIRDKNPGSVVTLISAGPERVTEAIRSGLTKGADRGVRIELPETADSFLTAQALAGYLKKEPQVDLVFTGKEAIDDGAAQVTQLIAEFLGFPHVTVVLGVEWLSATQVKVKREIEGGSLEVIEAQLPLVLAAQKGLNEPRFSTMPNIIRAKKIEIQTFKLADFGLTEGQQKLRFKNFQLPPAKAAGKKLTGQPAEQAKELVRLLNQEAKVV